MLQSMLANDFLVLTVLVFVALMLFLESVYLTWRSRHGPRARKVQSRLRALSGGDGAAQSQLLKQPLDSELPPLERRLQAVARTRGLDGFVLQSGLDWSLSRLAITCAAMFLFGWFAVDVLLHQSFLMGLASGAVASTLPVLYVQYRRQKRLSKLEAQLPDALDLLSRALRAGHAFTSGLRMAGDELAEPIAGELRAVHEEVSFGVSMEQALTHLSDRVPLTDLRYFVVAVLIQRDSGGNLTEILGNLSHLLRERAKLFARVKVLSSEGRMSAWILTIMPFALAGILHAMNPKFVSLLWTDPMGQAMVKYLLIMMAFGVLVMRKIIRIRY